jgi:redox-sensing transcriptional repressor
MAIPEPAKARLLHIMALLEKQGGPLTSAEVEALTGWPSHTIRKDISSLGSGGVGSGAGYSPEALVPLIRRALGLDRQRRCCVVGLGRLGSAYINYRRMPVQASGRRPNQPPEPLAGRIGGPLPDRLAEQTAGLPDEEFELVAGFDSNVNRLELLSAPAPLYPAYKMGEVIRRFNIELALLCVPSGAAQGAAEKLVEAGIRGILNFAPVILNLPAECIVRNVSVMDELRSLAMKL